MSETLDPYRLDPQDVAEPPSGFLNTLRRIGPGMILAASIVGSGELIATTTLGAKVGYAALWVILLSCLIKPAVQAEMGRYVIATGETGLEAFNKLPGPRFGPGNGVSWIVWCWAVMVLLTLLQIGAMFGGVAQVLNLVIPRIPIGAWVVMLLIVTLALLLGGAYERIERLAMVKVGLFTLLTFLAAVILTRQTGFRWSELATGFQFKMPGEGLATAVAVFGITGVGASELFMYPYWCVEKGYARYTGKRNETKQWEARARGWVRVMNVDIIASMVVYTVATVAFYLLGAGVLHRMGKDPASGDMILVLSNTYTATLGPWSLWLFYLGAIATLYGTIFAATAAHSRIFADLFRLLGYFSRDDYAARLRFRKVWVVILTIIPVILYFAIESPVKMVVAGGLAQAAMLPIIAVGTLILRHRHLPREIVPSRLVTAGLWFAAAVIVLLMCYYVINQLL
ncbi:MAG: Nramp family divalent metal transporter [Acidobacteriota bacterium]